MNQGQKMTSLAQAKRAWNTARTGSLSVLDVDTGGPLGTLVNVAVTEAFEPIILTSQLSRHTRCLDADGRASIMVTETLPAEGDPLTGFRATLTGVLERNRDPAIRSLYLTHHPYAELYAGFADFGFWRMTPHKLYVVAGFGLVFDYPARILQSQS
jgi:putative heme iron utilization protein